MHITTSTSWIAFARSKCIAKGAPREVASAVKSYVDSHPAQSVLLFDASTSQPVEIDLRGSLAATPHIAFIGASSMAVMLAKVLASVKERGLPISCCQTNQ